MTNEPDLSEKITLTYQGHGELFEASLRSSTGLKAQSTYEWLNRAIRAISFDTLAEPIQQKEL